MKFSNLLPEEARAKVNGALAGKGVNVDLDCLVGGQLEELVEQLADLQVDVDGSDGEKVRIYCE